MTPMKKLKGQFSELNEFLSPFFSQFILNESRPKEIPYPFQRSHHQNSVSKGVKEDHLRIYKDLNSDSSIAFIFDYKGKDEEDWRFYTSIKATNNNDSIIYSQPLNYNQFKKELNSFLSDLREEYRSKKNKINNEFIFNKICSIFIKESLDFKLEQEKAEKKITEHTLPIFNKIQENTIQLNYNRDHIIKIKDSIRASITRSADYKRLIQLKKEVEELTLKIHDKTKLKEEEKDIPQKTKLVESLKNENTVLNNTLKEVTKKLANDNPKMVSKLIRTKIL